MPRGTLLSDAVDQLRYELKESVNAATGKNTRDHRKYVLRRTQQRLYEDYQWPFLRVTHYIEVAAGQRYYDFPTNMPFEKVQKVQYRYNTHWYNLIEGIGAAEYNFYDSGEDFRTDPVSNWAPYNEDIAGQAQIEIWPVPTTNGFLYNGTPHGEATYTEGSNVNGNGVLQFTGIRDLNPLVEDTDRLDLDDALVVMYAAAKITTDRTMKEELLAEADRYRSNLMNRQKKNRIHKISTKAPKHPHYNRPISVRAAVDND